MITVAQYFGAKAHSAEQTQFAMDLLDRVNRLKVEAAADGAFCQQIDPDTGTEISGVRGGAGDGGFRLPTATTGAGRSSHKEAKGVDSYDPDNALDKWLDKFESAGGANSKLKEYGLVREHPSATIGWCHLSTRPVGTKQTFYP